MAQLDDVKKIEVEVFDDKLLVGNAIVDAFLGKLLSFGYVDTDFPQPQGIIVTLKRFTHFMQGFLATKLDATFIAWKKKVNYDLVRPTSIIKRFDEDIATWAPGGVETFPAGNFEACARVLPHSEYVSGSNCSFQAEVDYTTGYLTEMA